MGVVSVLAACVLGLRGAVGALCAEKQESDVSAEQTTSGAVGPDDITEALAHLGAALVQSIPSDDQIIMGHVRDAYRLLGGSSARLAEITGGAVAS